MFLKSLFLQNFRNYSKSEFHFSKETTFIVGPNTSGKTNFLEAIYLLSTGKSFKTQNDLEAIQFKKEIGRIKGGIDGTDLEMVLTQTLKKYLVNGVSKRRVDFAGRLLTVLFSPSDLDLVTDSPSLRRNFLDSVLEQIDREYRLAIVSYSKALRQRNALLQKAQEKGLRNQKQFEYWDGILIKNGEIITQKREEFIEFVNKAEKEVFDFSIVYDKSVISEERLLQYEDAEIGAGVTLVGPHRDDFIMRMGTDELKSFGSRGQQRLTVLQLKLIQLLFIKQITGEQPILLLDDIFSELDQGHINLVLEMIKSGQTIITTTHKEFIPKAILKRSAVIELEKQQLTISD